MNYRLTERGYWVLVTLGIVLWVALILNIGGCSTENPCGM